MNDIDIEIYIKKFPERICQGNIYRDISTEEIRILDDNKRKIKEIPIEFSVVVNQDCDLDQDYKARKDSSKPKEITHDKYLSNILLCPLYLFDSFREGNHLLEFDRKIKRKNSDETRQIKKNNNFRYHFFIKDSKIPIAELVADFKHFFTVERDIFYDTYHNKLHFICSLNFLYREDLNQRFTNFLARIPLPDLPQE